MNCTSPIEVGPLNEATRIVSDGLAESSGEKQNREHAANDRQVDSVIKVARVIERVIERSLARTDEEVVEGAAERVLEEAIKKAFRYMITASFRQAYSKRGGLCAGDDVIFPREVFQNTLRKSL